jgi:tetratricopeptide (TPR) repeat protein
MKIVLVGFCRLVLIGGVILLSACNGGSKGAQQESPKKDSVKGPVDTISPKIELYKKKVAKNPKDADSYWKLGMLEAAIKQYPTAIQDYNNAIKIDSTKAEYYFMLADADFVSGRTHESKDAFEKCVSLDPKNTKALMRLGELYFYVKKYPEAIECIDKTLKIDPHFARAYFMKGMIFLEKHDTTKALSSMQTAVEQDPKYFDAYIQLGLVYTHKGKSIALDYFNDAINVQPGNVEPYYDKGMFYQNGQDYDDAVKAYNELLQVDSTYKYALYNLGVIYCIYKPDYKKAIYYFDKAIRFDKTYSMAYYGRGNCYEQLNQLDKALEDFSYAVQYNQKFDAAREAMKEVKAKMH